MGTWMELSRGVVHPWHQDHFGHMNTRHYAPFFDDAIYHLWTELGLPYSTLLAEHGVHTVTAAATTTFVKELVAGDLIRIDGAIIRIGTKSATAKLRMHHADTGALHATYDVVEVFFSPETRLSVPIPEAVGTKLAAALVAS